MARVLVVWIEWPETVKFVELSVSDTTKLASFHNQYINSQATSGHIVNEMLKFFNDEKGYFKFQPSEGPLSGHYDLIIHCGWIL